MPELPDVEHFKRYFNNNCLNQKIVDISSSSKSQIRKGTFKDFKEKLTGKSFQDSYRRGKFLLIDIKGLAEKLIFHFGMTGSFDYVCPKKEVFEKSRFARLKFEFKNGCELRWINKRRLGKVYLVSQPNEVNLLKEMGPEPLSLSKAEFLELLEEHENKNIKAFLLDQRDIAGIGNVYSDEILFQAKIDPHRKIKSLKKNERKRIYQKMIKVLELASRSKKKVSRSWLLKNRRPGGNCPRNKNHQLKREIIAGRAAIYCPQCQNQGRF